MSIRNVLVLIFDHGLLSVEQGGLRVVVGSRLSNSEYGELEGRKLLVPSRSEFAPDRRYLSVKYREFQMIEKAS